MTPKSRDERLFGAACLRLTLESTRGDRGGASEIYRETLRDLALTEEDVDAYLEQHRERIEAALRTRLAKR